ncbi:hypothetical protein MTR67_044459 [Solanum verrucosum]|uniref:R13L1/DRL21-like LRR repeat region domain-containing protein n=1 Tax=Solanum verrucosum TaxID=315347 RepID=A0AAF0UTI2_SOLVR|nr:hypothetical protein MTR67_044459 [Solanum verrucosum]
MKRVASTIPVDLHMLGRLTRDHCWSIFNQRAFVDGEVPEEVVSMKNRIVEMCQGLPLAASVLGGLLRNKKPNIYKMAYLWSHDELEGCEINDEHVLDGLQPHPNFTKFPSWFTKGLLPNLVMLKLSGCKRCKHIPSLGQMKFLRHLELLGVLEL